MWWIEAFFLLPSKRFGTAKEIDLFLLYTEDIWVYYQKDNYEIKVKNFCFLFDFVYTSIHRKHET